MSSSVHPIAQAVLAYFLEDRGAELGMEPETFLDRLFGMVDVLPPDEVATCGDDLLDVARSLKQSGQPLAAKMLAERIERSARRATVRAEAAPVFAASLDHVAKIEHALTPPQPPQQEKRPSLLEQRWSELSPERKEKLRRLAEEFLG